MTLVEAQAILTAIDAAILARASGVGNFTTTAPGGGSFEYEQMPMDELLRLRKLTGGIVYRLGGMKPAEPKRPGVDVDLETDNNDGVV